MHQTKSQKLIKTAKNNGKESLETGEKFIKVEKKCARQLRKKNW